MHYKNMGDDEFAAILRDRISGYEREYYAHELNRDLALASDPDDEDAQRRVEEAEKAMATIDKAHEEAVKKLEALEPPAPAQAAEGSAAPARSSKKNS